MCILYTSITVLWVWLLYVSMAASSSVFWSDNEQIISHRNILGKSLFA